MSKLNSHHIELYMLGVITGKLVANTLLQPAHDLVDTFGPSAGRSTILHAVSAAAWCQAGQASHNWLLCPRAVFRDFVLLLNLFEGHGRLASPELQPHLLLGPAHGLCGGGYARSEVGSLSQVVLPARIAVDLNEDLMLRLIRYTLPLCYVSFADNLGTATWSPAWTLNCTSCCCCCRRCCFAVRRAAELQNCILLCVVLQNCRTASCYAKEDCPDFHFRDGEGR